MCKTQNKSGCTQIYSPDPNHWIFKAWLAKAEQNLEAKHGKYSPFDDDEKYHQSFA